MRHYLTMTSQHRVGVNTIRRHSFGSTAVAERLLISEWSLCTNLRDAAAPQRTTLCANCVLWHRTMIAAGGRSPSEAAKTDHPDFIDDFFRPRPPFAPMLGLSAVRGEEFQAQGVEACFLFIAKRIVEIVQRRADCLQRLQHGLQPLALGIEAARRGA